MEQWSLHHVWTAPDGKYIHRYAHTYVYTTKGQASVRESCRLESLWRSISETPDGDGLRSVLAAAASWSQSSGTDRARRRHAKLWRPNSPDYPVLPDWVVGVRHCPHALLSNLVWVLNMTLCVFIHSSLTHANILASPKRWRKDGPTTNNASDCGLDNQ